MAKAEKYFLRFSSINGTPYRVSIAVEGFSGTATELVGAGDPIQIEESDSNSIFEPVRTWSGYLRVICTFDEWLEMIPESYTSSKITITRGSATTPFFVGYLRPENYNTQFMPTASMYELQFTCALGVLEALEYTPVFAYKTFAASISEILRMSFGNDELQSVVTSPVVLLGHGEGGADLHSKINTFAFFTVNTKFDPLKPETFDNSRIESEYTALEALKHLCTFWGWAIRYYEGKIYITCPDSMYISQTTPVEYAWSDFPALSQPSQLPSSQIDIISNRFVKNGTQITILSPSRKVTVDVIEKWPEPIEYELNRLPYDGNIDTRVVGDNTYAREAVGGTGVALGTEIGWNEDEQHNLVQHTVSSSSMDVYDADGGLWTLRKFEFVDYGGDQTFSMGLGACRIDTWETIATADHTKYDWKYIMPIGYLTTVSPAQDYYRHIDPCYRLTTNYRMGFANAWMRIKAKVYCANSWIKQSEDYLNGNRWIYENGVGSTVTGVNFSNIRAMIKCGTLYWTGTTWSSSMPSEPLLIPFGDPTKARDVIYNDADPTSAEYGYGELLDGKGTNDVNKGYRLRMPSNVSDAQLEITFYHQGWYDTIPGTMICVGDVDVSYEEDEQKDIQYDLYTDTDSRNEETIDTLFHIDLEGSSVITKILYPNGSFAGTYYYDFGHGEEEEDPLSVLVHRMKNIFKAPRIVRKLEYVDATGLTPIDYAYYSGEIKRYAPISFAYDLVNDRLTIKTIDITW